MQVFRSKVDIWLLTVVFAPFIYAVIDCLLSAEYDALFVLVPVCGVLIWLFTTIKYVVTEDQIKVYSLLCKENIDVNAIRSVEKTNSILSAPALSMKRLEIKYGSNFDYIIVSPKESKQFVDLLLQRNPDIQVKL